MNKQKDSDMYDRIEKLLTSKKISKRKLAFDLKIPYTTLVSMFARRSKSVNTEILKKIAKYLGAKIDYLING